MATTAAWSRTAPVRTAVAEFRDAGGALVAASLIDRLDDGVSAVYSFYDPRSRTAQPRHLEHPVAGRGMPAAGPALRLSRLLDRREPEDGLQGALSGARAPDRRRLGRFASSRRTASRIPAPASQRRWSAASDRSCMAHRHALNRRPVRRHVRHRGDARGVRRAGVSGALRRGRGGAGARPGAARHRPGRGGRRRSRRRPPRSPTTRMRSTWRG